ncbi:MAG: hypothetical protein JNK79_18895 [Chitinophagaceae bacterium]|nr:hypothetical protein [Chitinophagaceae bacterium]
MGRIVSIPIVYKNNEYYLLAKFSEVSGSTELRVTIMNGDLENLLYGNHIFKYEGGRLISNTPAKGYAAELKAEVMRALEEFLSTTA